MPLPCRAMPPASVSFAMSPLPCHLIPPALAASAMPLPSPGTPRHAAAMLCHAASCRPPWQPQPCRCPSLICCTMPSPMPRHAASLSSLCHVTDAMPRCAASLSSLCHGTDAMPRCAASLSSLCHVISAMPRRAASLSSLRHVAGAMSRHAASFNTPFWLLGLRYILTSCRHTDTEECRLYLKKYRVDISTFLAIADSTGINI